MWQVLNLTLDISFKVVHKVKNSKGISHFHSIRIAYNSFRKNEVILTLSIDMINTIELLFA